MVNDAWLAHDTCNLIVESGIDCQHETEGLVLRLDDVHRGQKACKYRKFFLVPALLLSALAVGTTFAGRPVSRHGPRYDGFAGLDLTNYKDFSRKMSSVTVGHSWHEIGTVVDNVLSGSGCANITATALCTFLQAATPADRDVILANWDIPGRSTTTSGPLPASGVSIPASWPSAAGMKYAPTCKPYPGKRVIFLTVNFQFIDMFRNWLHYARAYVNESTEQIVVFPDDNFTAIRLQTMNVSIPFEVANPDDFFARSQEPATSGEEHRTTAMPEARRDTATEDQQQHRQSAPFPTFPLDPFPKPRASSHTFDIFNPWLRTIFNAWMPLLWPVTLGGALSRPSSWTGFASEAASHRRLYDYGTTKYANLMKERPALLHHLLANNCTVLYVDVDTAWRKPVFPALAKAGIHSLYVPTDDAYNSQRGHTNLCPALLYMQPLNSTMELMLDWDQRVKNSRLGMNQPHFNQALLHSAVDYAVLPVQSFPNGFEVDRHPAIAASAVVLHANYRVGLANKTNFFKAHGAWSV